VRGEPTRGRSGGAGRQTLDHRLGLRVLGGFVVLYLAVWLATLVLGVGPNMLMRHLGVPDSQRILVGSTISRSGTLAVILFLSVIALRRVVGLSPEEVMFPVRSGWWRDLLVGLVLAGGAMGLLFAVERAAGWLAVSGWRWNEAPTAAWLRSLWLALLANLLAAVGEEAMFRGYLLPGLRRAWGKGAALLIMAVLFAVPHLLVSGAAQTHWAVFTAALALPGLMLGWTALRSGDLWLPVGIHFAWNLFQGDVFNLTGNAAGGTMFGAVTELTGPAWGVGTSYGIEVGVSGVLALMLVSAGVWLWMRPSHGTGRGDSG